MTRRTKATPTWALAAIGVLLAAGCARQADWYPIESAEAGPDGRTITATILTGKPGSDGKFCDEVTGTMVSETGDRVVLGVEVRDVCEPLLPWEKRISSNMGYAREYQFHLDSPLAGRPLMDRATDQRIPML
ncbi:unnamed protein product [[Actinomadura] parvosata subsp. kistnae]|nr:unnamed protein product [Actinomadura parvosata subsp. kistnae]